MALVLVVLAGAPAFGRVAECGESPMEKFNEAEKRVIKNLESRTDAQILGDLQRNAGHTDMSMEQGIETSALIQMVEKRHIVKAKKILAGMAKWYGSLAQRQPRWTHRLSPEAIVSGEAERVLLEIDLFDSGVVDEKEVFQELIERIRKKIKETGVAINAEAAVLTRVAAENTAEVLALFGNEREEDSMRLVGLDNLQYCGDRVDQGRIVDVLANSIVANRPKIVWGALGYLRNHGRADMVDRLINVLDETNNDTYVPHIVDALGELSNRGMLGNAQIEKLKLASEKKSAVHRDRIDSVIEKFQGAKMKPAFPVAR